MTRWLLSMSILAAATAHPTERLWGQEDQIGQLEWLVGEWTFEDVEIDGEYREAGTRSCEYTLGGDYIVCESLGVDHRGQERSYIWYFNHNPDESRFEVTSLLEGYPAKLLYTATLHDAGRRLELSYGSWEGDLVVVDGGATVTYNGTDQYVWGNERFRDVVTRR